MVIYSLSKPIAPDIKLSFLVHPKNKFSEVKRVIKLTNSHPSILFSGLVSDLILSNALKELIIKKRETGAYFQSLVRSKLANNSYIRHKYAWHIWVQIPTQFTAESFVKMMIGKGVDVMGGHEFAVGSSDNINCIRIAFGGEQDETRIIRGLELIREHLDLYKSN